jgi:3-oxoacyl-[acyl-carrier protein] reductase
MDLGIRDRKAIVCGSSRGLGRACATSLAREGVAVVINGITSERVAKAAAEIRAETGSNVTGVVADITTEAGRKALLRSCEEPDILVTNNSGPPPGDLDDWSYADWLRALEANMLAPIFLIKAVLPGMRSRRFGRIVNITSAVVKQPRPPMGLSGSVRLGLTGLSKAISRDAARDNVTINNILPERIDTDRQKFLAERRARLENITFEEARARIADGLGTKRLGRPEEFGDACAYLCSAQAGYITGQNLLLDGGTYEGLF